MSKKKKKVVKPSSSARARTTGNKKVAVTKESSVRKKKAAEAPARSKVEESKEPLLFTKRTFGFMAIGAGLIALGMLLMTGGGMPDPNTWDESIIYSARRTILAPIVILAGLIVNVYAIFKG